MNMQEQIARTPASRLRIPDGTGSVAGIELDY